MKTKTLIVSSKLGIHARPSRLIVITASKFESKITFKKGKTKASAKSIIEIMMLMAAYQDTLDIIVEGVDEVAAMNAIEELFKTDFADCYE